MNGRSPCNRTPSNRPFAGILFATVRISATGGGYKHIETGSDATVIIAAEGGGVVVVTGSSEAIVSIVAQGGGRRLTEDLYFIEEPEIKTQGIIATHVTVQSPTHEYTAEIVVPEENTIERIVKISEGNEDTCKAVADELLDKWGREQVSISGRVPLVVTLRFKQYVKVYVPTAGIDGEYILQRKEHDLSSFETRITVGDIILQDSDLLARIMEELDK